MSSIRDLLILRMKQKNLDKPLAGTMTLKELNYFFGRDDIAGHVKNNILFIKTYDQSLRIEIFQKRVELLAHLNNYLKNQGFAGDLSDVRLV